MPISTISRQDLSFKKFNCKRHHARLRFCCLRNWSTYICNRAAEILNNFTCSYWNHVYIKDNPADCASRGLYPSKLLEHQLW
ncbi:uncharacterized protein LOC122614269 isoform X2 [Drosophila teissieri]|uniref:uncharacterized protein LOC122614269 isoform X2 n=1 Tax=Drosophila teissieri TaxID=7243 RepID=UPI001CBA2854|nr:uncharacterized protein LOC122614269 isoform X2 [Drosophila teissieri]